jgi:hypothetical protein
MDLILYTEFNSTAFTMARPGFCLSPTSSGNILSSSLSSQTGIHLDPQVLSRLQYSLPALALLARNHLVDLSFKMTSSARYSLTYKVNTMFPFTHCLFTS